MLTFDLSALEYHQYFKNIVFSETTGQIELKCHNETHFLKGVGSRLITNVNGHMTKMVVMPI